MAASGPRREGPDPALLKRLERMGVRLGTGAIQPPPPPPPDRAERAREAAWDAADTRATGETGGNLAVLALEEAVPGWDWQGDLGRCWVTEARRELDDHHATEPLGAALQAGAAGLAALAGDPRLADMDLSRTAFLDTETTGLGWGAGTYAFLIGIGRLEGGQFRVRQFFMRHPGEEPAQLAAVAEWLEGCEGLVTFNGRTFDMPLLAGRCVAQRRPPFLARAPHLDLLPVARRVWRRRLESCSLGSLEREVFGLAREDDVPGWLIPYRYFRYQREGDARPLVGIFHHNLLDILSMVSLAARLGRAWQSPEGTLEHGLDWLSLARRYDLAGDPQRAMDACERALAHGLTPEEAGDALHQLALIARRAGEWERATTIWRTQADDPSHARLYPYEELAKFWEHRAQPPDLGLALDYTRRARELVEGGDLRPRRGRFVALAQLARRAERLEARIARSVAKPRRAAKA